MSQPRRNMPPSTLQNLKPVAVQQGQTPAQAAFQSSLSSPELVDVKFWVFSRRVSANDPDSGEPVSFRVINPLPVFGISLILLHTEYFKQLLSSGFVESSAETTFYAPYPPNEPDSIDDYDYASDSDLEDESDVQYDDWEVEVPQHPIVRNKPKVTMPLPVESDIKYEESEVEGSRYPIIRNRPKVTMPVSVEWPESAPARATRSHAHKREPREEPRYTATEHESLEQASETVDIAEFDEDVSGIYPTAPSPPMRPTPVTPLEENLPVCTASAEKQAHGPGNPCRQIIVKDTAFITFRALVYYLYTGKVNFLPLRSRDPASRNATNKRLLANREHTAEPPACSPKSMYRLAEKIGISELEDLALEAIRTSLTAPIILREFLSEFTSRYKAVILVELQYLCFNYEDNAVKLRWPQAVIALLSGAFQHADEVMTMLLRVRLAAKQHPAPPSYSQTRTKANLRVERLFG